MVKILSIESSCDETASAVVEEGGRVLSNIVASQIEAHKSFGGVIPELAARMHIEAILPVIQEALDKAKVELSDIDAIAVTQGPGLLGSLLIGLNTARTLAFTKEKPLIAVNHLEGHIYANFISDFKCQRSNDKCGEPKFPLLCLVVSGGHTNIVYMKDHLRYETVGQTIDDAAGETFDKVAKVLGLGYPGGPIVSKLAVAGNKDKYDFPRIDLTPPPARDDRGYLIKPQPNLNFSFSGLKTAEIGRASCRERV